jgi:hypothetical protein
MDLIDVFLEGTSDNIEYEDEYFKVLKIIKEIPTGSIYYVKRIQLVKWNGKQTDIPDLDIRTFDKRTKKYKKGITLSINESKELYKALAEYFNSN